MQIATDDALLKAANKAMRIAVAVYVAVKQVVYTTMFEDIYWIPRAWAGAIMLIIAFAPMLFKKMSKKHISWIVPVTLAMTEIILVASFGGDRLTYIFLVGCALVSLLYMETTGLLITIVSSCSVAAAALFVFGRTLIGDFDDFTNDLYNLMGLVVVDVVIYLIGKYAIGTTTKAKQAVEQALRKAQEANRAKSNFLATMSHEIRTPMNAILGIAQLQLQEENLPDKYAQATNRIIDSGNTLLNIINDILDMSKIESGNMELVCAEFDVPGLINDAVQLNIVRLGSSPIEFIPDIDEKLPKKLYGDELRLKQILNNLLSNAIKYTESGYVKLGVKSEETDTDEISLIIRVEDTGQGIKPEDCEKIFIAEYTRFNAETNRSKEGTGLGLSITKSLVELMNGEIKVESEYGKGSVFTAIVKLKVADRQPIGQDVAVSLSDFTFIDNRYRERRKVVRNLMPYGKILVVDDVESNLYVAKGLLMQYKLNIETANSGFKAIEHIDNGSEYDVIFMDHMMPKMDGIETAEKLRELGYTGTIIALTANALVGNDEMFRQHGFDGFIAKPINIEQLDMVLNKFVRDRHPEQAKENVQQEISSDTDDKIDSQQLIRAFCRDAETAVVALRESTADKDIKKLTAAAHSMKSALANIRENEMSARAAALEKAGQDGDRAFIDENVGDFIDDLEVLADKLGIRNEELGIANGDSVTIEDTALLSEQLEIIINACEEYDDATALDAIKKLRESKLKRETSDILDNIYDALYTDSDFEKAAALAEKLKNTEKDG